MAKQSRNLNGTVAVVTGGGRGIGAAIARALAREGVKVAVADLDGDTARSVADEIGNGAVAFTLDVTDRPAFTACLDEVESRLGPIDILVNNAGIMALARIEDETDASTTRQLELNLHAVIHGTREAVRRMRPRRTGHIINVASSAGKSGFPGGATYCATKFGVVGFSEAVRGEVRDDGIEVSVVMPGIVKTELASGLQDARGVKAVTPEQVADHVLAALKAPYFDVFVPKSIAAIHAVVSPFPRKVREGVARAIKADRVLLDAAHSSARAAYEARAAQSAPHAEALAEEAESESALA